MRIISDFHDYYDTAMGLGQDPKLVWNRRTVELADGPGEDVAYTMGRSGWHAWELRRKKHRIEWSVQTLLFCGERFPLVMVHKRTKLGNWTTSYCWRPEDVDAVLEGDKKLWAAFQKEPNTRWWGRQRFYRFSPDGIHRLFTSAPPDPRTEQLHRKYHKAVLLIRPKDRGSRQVTVIDPVLKDIEFQRVRDPYSCFQQIAGYLGGVLGIPEMEHRPIPDEDMRDMKGFDEWSFKQHSPGDKKRRRRGRKKRS